MVLEYAMKKFVYISLFSIATIIVGTVAIVPLTNKIYGLVYDLVPGPDAETRLLDFMVYIQWPIFAISGGFIGNIVYRKTNGKKRNSK